MLLYLFILVGSLDGLWGKSLLDEDPNSLKKMPKGNVTTLLSNVKHKDSDRALETPKLERWFSRPWASPGSRRVVVSWGCWPEPSLLLWSRESYLRRGRQFQDGQTNRGGVWGACGREEGERGLTLLTYCQGWRGGPQLWGCWRLPAAHTSCISPLRQWSTRHGEKPPTAVNVSIYWLISVLQPLHFTNDKKTEKIWKRTKNKMLSLLIWIFKGY